MQFSLTPALIDDILFSMENQDIEFRLDTFSGIVVGPDSDELDEIQEETAEDEERFISLPEWGPSEGFHLMERFTAALHNPAARDELSAALERGRGVFRAFKDTLSRYPELEKRWRVFKDREMKREIVDWYNALRETWGLEAIGEEPDEVEDIVLEDFRFREGSAADGEAAAALHRLCSESGGAADSVVDGTAVPVVPTAEDTAAMLAEMNAWQFPGDYCLVAENAGGEFAAYISASVAARRLHIFALEVQPEYRGLGIGEALLARLLEKIDRGNIACASIDLPETAQHFARVLLRENFAPCVQRYWRKAGKQPL